MKKVKIFGSIEKEEQWLNEMNDNGYEFVKKSVFNVFVEKRNKRFLNRKLTK